METRKYKTSIGFIYEMPAQHCVFCKHCTDIFYDATNGPYMFFCKIGIENGTYMEYETCGKFESEDVTNNEQRKAD